MEFNRLVFPAPDPSYTPFTLEKLLWIPRSRFFSLKKFAKKMDTFENMYFESRTFTEADNIQKQSKNIV